MRAGHWAKYRYRLACGWCTSRVGPSTWDGGVLTSKKMGLSVVAKELIRFEWGADPIWMRVFIRHDWEVAMSAKALQWEGNLPVWLGLRNNGGFVHSIVNMGPRLLLRVEYGAHLIWMEAGVVLIRNEWAWPFGWLWLCQTHHPRSGPLSKCFHDSFSCRDSLQAQAIINTFSCCRALAWSTSFNSDNRIVSITLNGASISKIFRTQHSRYVLQQQSVQCLLPRVSAK